jgi:DNA-binding NarL/FixJ family response regulator
MAGTLTQREPASVRHSARIADVALAAITVVLVVAVAHTLAVVGVHLNVAAHDLTPGAGWRLAVLTARETEVVQLIALGLSNSEIATRLGISPLTAKTHSSRAIAKLNLRDRVQLVILAYESGLVRPGR